jgi:hypothetical protein
MEKYKILTMIFFCFTFVSCEKQEVKQQNERFFDDDIKTKANREITISISCNFGRRKYSCLEGAWFCVNSCEITVEGYEKVSRGGHKNNDRTLGVDFRVENNNNKEVVFVNFKENNILNGEPYLFAEEGEDFTLPREISAILGYKELVLKHGKYEIDYSQNPNGEAVIDLAKAVK